MKNPEKLATLGTQRHPVSLDSSFLCVLCTQCCQCLWIVHSSVSCVPIVASVSGLSIPLCLLYPMLPVSLDCSFLCVLCTQCCQCLWIIHSSVSCVPNIVSVSGTQRNGQSRDTGNIGYTRHRGMNNPETLATFCTEDTEEWTIQRH
jgi:hypothetical protein